MTVLEVRPHRADWIVTGNHGEPLSFHATADAALRAATSVLSSEDDGELYLRDRYGRTLALGHPQGETPTIH